MTTHKKRVHGVDVELNSCTPQPNPMWGPPPEKEAVTAPMDPVTVEANNDFSAALQIFPDPEEDQGFFQDLYAAEAPPVHVAVEAVPVAVEAMPSAIQAPQVAAEVPPREADLPVGVPVPPSLRPMPAPASAGGAVIQQVRNDVARMPAQQIERMWEHPSRMIGGITYRRVTETVTLTDGTQYQSVVEELEKPEKPRKSSKSASHNKRSSSAKK